MFHWFGDPTMKLWTNLPDSVTMTHDDTIFEGATSLEITTGSALVPILICISKGSEILSKGMCNAYETCNFSWNSPLVTGDTIKVTATGDNIRPYQGNLLCQETAGECKGDLNGDYQCDMADWLIFGEDWGRFDCKNPGTEICECDLNQEGKCDMTDWLIFGNDWGRTDCP